MRPIKLTWFFGQGLTLAVILGPGATAGATAAAQSTEDRLLEVLRSDAPAADKCNACRELQTAGSEKSVPALAALLLDPAVSHTARVALEAMPYPAVDAALRDAVGRTSGLTRSGIIDSLGERRDAAAVAILADALKDSDFQVRAASAAALGKIGTREAADALSAAWAAAPSDDRAILGQGLIRCADRLREAGKRDEAAAIYANLSEPGEPGVVRMAALRGRFEAAGPDAARALAEALADGDTLVRQAAAGQLGRLSDTAFRALAGRMSDLPAEGRGAMLAAIRIRQDRSLAPVVLKAAGDDDPAVRIAAVRALAVVGSAAALPVLLQYSAGDDPLGRAAKLSLRRICDPRLDRQIAERLRAEQDPLRRAAWIELVAARRPAGAVDLLLEEATGVHPEVRTRAMAALADLAEPKNVPAMVSAVLRAEKGAERDNAEKAVMLVCQQIPDPEKRTEPIIEVFDRSDRAGRAALLPLLGRVGGSKAKGVVQAALTADDDETYDAGVRAICNWPDASVAGQLIELSQDARSATHRLWALRALIRVIALPGDMPDAEKLSLLKQAMERAERDDERRLVLERASAVRTVETLRFLLPHLDRPPLAQTAAASIVELARHKELRDPNSEEFIGALERVLKTSRDTTVLEQARRCLQEAREG